MRRSRRAGSPVSTEGGSPGGWEATSERAGAAPFAGSGVAPALGMDPDHAVVDAALLHDQGSHHGVAFETPGTRDLEPVGGDHVATDKARDRDPRAPNVRLHVCFRPDQEVAVRLDLPAEA